MTPRFLSIFDLAKVPGAIGIIQRNDQQEVDHLLDSLGFDTKLGVSYEDVWHRPLTATTNEPQYGVRICGYEKSSPDWLKSGNASWDALTENIDASLRDDLINMGRGGSSDRVFVDENTAEKYVLVEQEKIKDQGEEG